MDRTTRTPGDPDKYAHKVGNIAMGTNFQFIDIAGIEAIRGAILPHIPEELFTATSSSVSYPPQVMSVAFALPELRAEMERLGMLDYWFATAVITVKPNGMLPIHTDTGDYTYSLNIPMHNFEDGDTVFYSTSVEPVFMPRSNGSGSYQKFMPEHCTETERFTLNRPALMNTQVPHSVINSSSTSRIALGLRLAHSFDESPFFPTA